MLCGTYDTLRVVEMRGFYTGYAGVRRKVSASTAVFRFITYILDFLSLSQNDADNGSSLV